MLLCGLLSSCGEQGLLGSCSFRASHCGSYSRCRARALGYMGSLAVAPALWSTGSIAVVHRFSCSEACGIFPDQGLNVYVLHWQVDSLPLSPQGKLLLFKKYYFSPHWSSYKTHCQTADISFLISSNFRASQVVLVVKNPPASAGRWKRQFWSLGWEGLLDQGMATHSSIYAWRIPWTEEPSGLRSIGSQRVQHDWSDLTHTHTHTHTQSPILCPVLCQ